MEGLLPRVAPWQPAAGELARATRLLLLRSRRESAGGLGGRYRSAFRGSGVEFEESRPYVPGDDLRRLDWRVLARTGLPFVKHYREERDQSLLLLVDIYRSMAFGSGGRSKASLAARTAALAAAAAQRAGDPVGLFTFDRIVRTEIPPARGPAQGWRVLRALVEAPGHPGEGTSLAVALERIQQIRSRRAILLLLSDFRDPGLFGAAQPGPAEKALEALARRNDLVAGVIEDPLERALPAVGPLRVVDAERGGRARLLRSGSVALRRRYQRSGAQRRRRLERRLRACGADPLWLRTDRDPLRVLGPFLARRAARLPERRR